MEKSTEQIRIVVTGPESSGKTSLSKELSNHFSAPLISEYSREFLESTNGKYEKEDLLTIAKFQYKLQNSIKDKPLLIADTGLLVIKVWSMYKYGEVDPWIETHLRGYADLYLLCSPDLTWTEDPLRENPDDRDILFNMYHQELLKIEAKYSIIKGQNRFEMAKQAIDAFL